MLKERHKIIPACYLLLTKDDLILLLRRFNTGWEDGNYSLVAGHLDGEETFRQAMVREAKEEAGIILSPNDLKVVHIMQRYSVPNEPQFRERIDIFIQAKNWTGEPKNMEPDKCDDLGWFPLNDLPKNVIPFIIKAIECAKNNIFYSEFGF